MFFFLLLYDKGSKDGFETAKMLGDEINPNIGKNGLEYASVVHFEDNAPVSVRWNQAIENTRNDFLVFLNNDMIFHKPGWMSLLTDPLSSSEVGASGSHILHWNGFYFLEGSIFAFTRQTAQEVKNADGYVFDEQFEFTCEDADFCHRLGFRGKRLQEVRVEGDHITHLHHGTLCSSH